MSAKQIYQITIESHLSLNFTRWLEDAQLQHTSDGNTILTASLPDQTALHGVLVHIRDLGLSLVEVKRIEIDKE